MKLRLNERERDLLLARMNGGMTVGSVDDVLAIEKTRQKIRARAPDGWTAEDHQLLSQLFSGMPAAVALVLLNVAKQLVALRAEIVAAAEAKADESAPETLADPPEEEEESDDTPEPELDEEEEPPTPPVAEESRPAEPEEPPKEATNAIEAGP